MVSLAGLAVTRLPATVARLRICGAPTCHEALTNGKARSRSNLDAATALWVTSGPIWMISSSSMVMWSRSGRRVMSINGLDAFADAAFEFEHQVGCSGDKAGFFPFISQELQAFLQVRWG